MDLHKWARGTIFALSHQLLLTVRHTRKSRRTWLAIFRWTVLLRSAMSLGNFNTSHEIIVYVIKTGRWLAEKYAVRHGVRKPLLG